MEQILKKLNEKSSNEKMMNEAAVSALLQVLSPQRQEKPEERVCKDMEEIVDSSKELMNFEI